MLSQVNGHILASFNRDLPTLAVSQKPHSLTGSRAFARGRTRVFARIFASTRARASRCGRFLKASKSGASNLPNRLPSDTFATPCVSTRTLVSAIIKSLHARDAVLRSAIRARALAKRLTTHIIYPRSRKHSRPTAICARIGARKLHTWRRRAISKRTRTSIRQRPRACRQQHC
jgi:hypothetical protein